jgi:CarD family transcriptional regulator, regulator of rRNA transcription
LAVGDVVVYAAYGLGRVVAREKRSTRNGKQEFVVLEFDDGLRVSLPIERALEQLRPLASEPELVRVQELLREVHAVSSEPWLARQRGVRAKLTAGDPVGLAEIVRDGAAREKSLLLKGTRPQLSPGERDLFVRARQLLSSEIAHVRGLPTGEADDWIDQQLAHT